MTTWIIEPRDPLIVRDGRPFGPTPGARATSLAFPFPSTTTGGARSRAGLDAQGRFDRGRIADVKRMAVHGPLLIELNERDEIGRWLAPAPADALLLDLDRPESGKAMRRRLEPLARSPGVETDLPPNLALVGPRQPDSRKPLSRPPRFWWWERFEQWLTKPEDGEEELPGLGEAGPGHEQRVHVTVRPDTLTAAEGALFQTRGLEFTTSDRRRLALAVVADGMLQGGLAPLGGERRLVVWRPSQVAPPACPPAVREAIVTARACRIILLTPACFAQGFRPTQLLLADGNVTPTLRAVACGRPAVVSGWDLETNQPKPTRRLAPTGSVYFLSFEGEPAAIGEWVDRHWMRCVSDAEQDRRDGFGLVALGTWSGISESVEETR